jgi:hypothetical protein
VAYELRGLWLEACDCHVMCPCWFEQDPDEGSCTGLTAWHVTKGQIDDVDVSDLTTVSVSYHAGHRGSARMRVALFVDDRATQEQASALERAFTGALGGPLADLAKLVGDVESVQRAPIVFTSGDGATQLSVGQALSLTMTAFTGSTRRVITIADSALATILGTPAEVGKSSQYKLDLGGESFDLDVTDRSANRGRFAYVKARSYG